MPFSCGKGGKRSSKNGGVGSAVLHHCLRQQAETAQKHEAFIRSLKETDAEVTADASPAPAGVAFGRSIARHRTLDFLTGNLTAPNPAKGSKLSRHKEQHLRSVLERSGLDEYLSTALAAQGRYSIDRYEARLLHGETEPALIKTSGALSDSRKDYEQAAEGCDLPIPRRPVVFSKELAAACKDVEQQERRQGGAAARNRRRRNRARVKLLLAGKMEEATIHNVQFVRQQRDELHRRFQKTREANKASGRRCRSLKDPAAHKAAGANDRASSYADSDAEWDSQADSRYSNAGGEELDEAAERSSDSHSQSSSPDLEGSSQPSLSGSSPEADSDATEAEQEGARPSAVDASSARIPLPRTAAELDAVELDSFLQWRRSLAALEGEGLVLTPYERNLEVWRQLWRVVERSHLVLQIVDGRSPAFFRCSDLEKYVKEVSQDKRVILVVNKTDLLPPAVRKQWAAHFAGIGVEAVFFSALRELDQQEKKEERLSEVEGSDAFSGSLHDSEGEFSSDSAEDQPGEDSTFSSTGASGPSTQLGGAASGDVLSSQALIDLLARHRESFLASRAVQQPSGEAETPAEFVVGTVGYPNVGKSSLINALLGLKKVSVSQQPGKTRRFQTIPLKGRGITLCDCPGLVFPKSVASKHMLVLNGVIPVDEMRGDYLPSVEMVCRAIPHSLLRLYGISAEAYREALKACERSSGPADPQLARGSQHQPLQERLAATPVLLAIAAQRHFVAAGKGGQPDLYRVAKIILRDFTSGRLLRCHLPGGEVFGGEAEAAEAANFMAEVRSSVETRLAGAPPPAASAPSSAAVSSGEHSRMRPHTQEQINPTAILRELQEDFDLLDVIDSAEAGQAAKRNAAYSVTKRKARQMQKQMQKGKGSSLAGYLARR
ncbi:hypothetical protein Efla_005953 [Eimeria flavescens]